MPLNPLARRDFLRLLGAIPLGFAFNGCLNEDSTTEEQTKHAEYLFTRDKVPDPQNIFFKVSYPGKREIKLAGHFWYNKATISSGKKCPAIVEFLPYRRRDGMMYTDSKMYPWFAYNDYLCFRIDLQGTGDSEGVLTDEYTDEELSYCIQVIQQIATHEYCDGNAGMMGKSWSAINSLMVASRSDCPDALKAIIVCCGTDDRYNDDVHYMGGAMMADNISWPSAMWNWLPLPPDPDIVGDQWKEMWRERIIHADFYFNQWASHQTRDEYWSATSVRDRYQDIKVPVFILSGFQDGYRNPVERVLSGLTALDKPVTGLIGPWGHKYPFSGVPGPQIDWLHYTVIHWWDKWLKGKSSPSDTAWPPFTVWLGESKEPSTSPCEEEKGKWVAEDGAWLSRSKEKVFYLHAENHLGDAASSEVLQIPQPLLLNSKMLETCSWGECDNDDLAGDQSFADSASLFFDSDILQEDIDCFGYPVVTMNLSCNATKANLAVRLCEISPATGASHLVTYTFFNCAYRKGDMALPELIEPDKIFNVRIPLNIMGHTFKKGWRIRLSISSSFFPTMWQLPEQPVITLHTAKTNNFPASRLMLPQRGAKTEDQLINALLSVKSSALYVDPSTYVPYKELRAASNSRIAEPITIDEKKGMVIKKVFDTGSYEYGGPLNEIISDQVAEENYQVMGNDPLSLSAFTKSTFILERRKSNWRTKSETSTKVWTEKTETGEFVFRYIATAQTYIVNAAGDEEPFEQKTVEGKIPRKWI